MRKRQMMVAMFLSALTLGACVENEESASVTNVRQAKAEQLKSVAAMNIAEAQAKLIFANAEAALKAAQADAEKANAEKTRAEIEIAKKQAELIELQKEAAKLENEAAVIGNKKKQAELEGQLAQLEVTKKSAEASLKRIADEMAQQEQRTKVALAQLQLELKRAEQNLLDYDKQIADAKTQAEKDKLDAEKRELQTLSTNYSNAITTLIGEQTALTSLKNSLVSMNNGLMTAEELKKQAIANNNTQIAFNKNKIDAYKKYTNYTEDVDALNAQLKQIDIELLPLEDKWNAAKSKFNSLTVNWDDINKAAESIYADDFYRFMSSRNGYSEVDADGNFTRISTFPFNNYISYKDGYNNYIESTSTKYTHKVGEKEYSNSYNLGDSYSVEYKFTGDPRNLELDVNAALKGQNDNLKSYKTGLENTQKQYNGKAVNWNGEAIRNAVDSTLYLKKAHVAETDQVKKDQLLREYEESLELEKSLAINISNYNLWIAGFDKEIARINKHYTMYKDAAKLTQALQVKIDARNKAVEALYAEKVIAWKESINAQVAYESKAAEINAIKALLDGNYAQGATSIKRMIETLEKDNVDREKANAEVSSITSQKEAIAYQEARIKGQEAIVAAKEIAVSDAKAALDAAMKNVQ